MYSSSIDASSWYYDCYDDVRFRCLVNQRSENLRYETCRQLDSSSSVGGDTTSSTSPTSSSLVNGNRVISGASGQSSTSPMPHVDLQNSSLVVMDSSCRRHDPTASFYRCAVACDADAAAMRRLASSNVAVDNSNADGNDVGIFFSLDAAADRHPMPPVYYDSSDVSMRSSAGINGDRTATVCQGDHRYTSSFANHDVGQIMPAAAAAAAHSCDGAWNGNGQFITPAFDPVTTSSSSPTHYFATTDPGMRWQTVDIDRRSYVSTWSPCRHAEDQLPAFGVTFRGGSPTAVVPVSSAVRGEIGGGELLHETAAATGYRRPSEGGALAVESAAALPPGNGIDGRAWTTMTARALNCRDDFTASFTSLPVVPHHAKHHQYDRCNWQTPMPLDIYSSPQQITPHVEIVVRQPAADGAADAKRSTMTPVDKPMKRSALRNRQDPEVAATPTTSFCWEPTTSCHRLQQIASVNQTTSQTVVLLISTLVYNDSEHAPARCVGIV